MSYSGGTDSLKLNLFLLADLVAITSDEEKGLIVTVDREKIKTVGVPAVGVRMSYSLLWTWGDILAFAIDIHCP